MKASVALRLGRVSNLPTVWTNVLAGLALAGAASPDPIATGALVLAASLFYVGGMYLNDAFDRAIDARERPERPIPSGEVAASTVFAAGFAMLAAGEGLIALVAYVLPRGQGAPPVLAGGALAGAIVLYDVYHKKNPLSPLLMGLCRMLVYVLAALSVAPALGMPVVLGALVLLGYLIGLTYTAKQENLFASAETAANLSPLRLWPLSLLAVPFVYTRALASPAGVALYLGLGVSIVLALRMLAPSRRQVPRAVGQLIAGISLVDGVLIAAHGSAWLALGCVAAFAATLLLQRHVPGT